LYLRRARTGRFCPTQLTGGIRTHGRLAADERLDHSRWSRRLSTGTPGSCVKPSGAIEAA